MDGTRIANGGSAIPRGPKTAKGRYICQRTVPTLQAGLTKMFGFMNVIFGILLVGNGIAVIVIRAGNYQVGAGVWSGTFSTCAGLVALMSGSKRKKVVIGCVVMTSFALVTVFAASIVAGTGIQADDAGSVTSDMVKAKIGLNVVTIALCVIIFLASVFILYLCAKALDDAAYAKDVDVSKLYPSQQTRTAMSGITNPVYVEEQTRGVSNGSVRILDPKEPILLVPLKDKQMDTLNISYDLTDGHNQTCRISRYNSTESIPWDRSVSREDLAHSGSQVDGRQNYTRQESQWCREVPVDIEAQGTGNVHRERKKGSSSDSGYIVLDTVDAKKASSYGISPETYRRSDGLVYEHPSLSHWSTLASLEMNSDSSHGFSDIVKMTPESGTPSSTSPDHESPPPVYPQDDINDEELRAFAKEFVKGICQAALDELNAELEMSGNSDISWSQSGSRAGAGTTSISTGTRMQDPGGITTSGRNSGGGGSLGSHDMIIGGTVDSSRKAFKGDKCDTAGTRTTSVEVHGQSRPETNSDVTEGTQSKWSVSTGEVAQTRTGGEFIVEKDSSGSAVAQGQCTTDMGQSESSTQLIGVSDTAPENAQRGGSAGSLSGSSRVQEGVEVKTLADMKDKTDDTNVGQGNEGDVKMKLFQSISKE